MGFTVLYTSYLPPDKEEILLLSFTRGKSPHHTSIQSMYLLSKAIQTACLRKHRVFHKKQDSRLHGCKHHTQMQRSGCHWFWAA